VSALDESVVNASTLFSVL